MAGWYQAGTVTVTNGSPVVTGVGTDFVNNVSPRDAFALIGGTLNEIASIESTTQMTLARPWLGATGGGQAYVVVPTVGVYVDLALRALNMLTPFQAVLDGVGQGIFAGGTVALPAMRFAADVDTGLRRYGENAVSLVGGGVDRFIVDAAGNVGIGGAPGYRLDVLAPAGPYLGRFFNTSTATDQYTVVLFGQGEAGSALGYIGTGGSTAGNPAFRGTFVVGTQNAKPLIFTTADSEKVRIDTAGNLLVGTSTGSNHRIVKAGVAGGSDILGLDNGAYGAVGIYAGNDGPMGSSALAVMKMSRVGSTGRSLSAGGTINASGADYAEYIRKAANCGTIAKGDVCGISRDGELVRTWADASRFVIKSTDPNLVGGDSWAEHLPSRPKAPDAIAAEPVPPTSASPAAMPTEPLREEGEDDLDFIRRMAAFLVEASAVAAGIAADRDAVATYQAEAAAYPALKAKYDAAVAAYEADIEAWERDLEAARQAVDRIAFSGQVPVNVDGDTLAACEAALADGVAIYLIASARGAGIGVSAVREGDMTLPLYMRRVGAVWAIRDGRPWVDVQHG